MTSLGPGLAGRFARLPLADKLAVARAVALALVVEVLVRASPLATTSQRLGCALDVP